MAMFRVPRKQTSRGAASSYGGRASGKGSIVNPLRRTGALSRGGSRPGSSGNATDKVVKTLATRTAADRKREKFIMRLAAKGIEYKPQNKFNQNQKFKPKEVKQKVEKKDASDGKDKKEAEPIYKHRMLIAPADSPAKRLTLLDMEKIQDAVINAFETLEDGCYPQFCGSYPDKGGVILACGSELTKAWMEKIVPKLQPWEGAKLCIKSKELVKGTEVQFKTPKVLAKTEPKKILEKISTQNKTLNTNKWKNVSAKSEASGQTLVYQVDEESLEAIRALDNKIYLGLGSVEVVIAPKDGDEKAAS